MFWLTVSSIVWSFNSILASMASNQRNYHLCLILSCAFLAYALFISKVTTPGADKEAAKKSKEEEREEQIADEKYGFRDDERFDK